MNFKKYCQSLSYNFSYGDSSIGLIAEKWKGQAPTLRIYKVDSKHDARLIYKVEIDDDIYKDLMNYEDRAIIYVEEALENDR